MTRRYRTEGVEVVTDEIGAPVRFRWRGRRYLVRAVIVHWVEAVPWWRGSFPAYPASGQRQVWRVEATGQFGGSGDVGRSGGRGLYELSRESRGESCELWQLVRVLD